MRCVNNTFKKRIDELGRIVIPKQIRNTYKINDFDELELYIQDDNIVIKKTMGIIQYKDKLNRLLKYVKDYNNIDAFIIEKELLVASNIADLNIDYLKLNDQEYIELNNIKGYVKKYQLIYDSNLYGEVIFVLKDNNLKELSLLKDIVNIILDYVN